MVTYESAPEYQNFRVVNGSAPRVGGGVYAIHKMQVRRDIANLLEQANRAEAKGDLDEATETLKRYLGFRFDDDENLVRYALLLDKKAETPEDSVAAVMALEQAHRRVPGNRDVQRKAADRLMQLGRYDDARPHLENLLGRNEPKSTTARNSRRKGGRSCSIAQCAFAGEDFDEAAKWYEAAIQHAPDQIESYYQLAELLRTKLDEVEAADRVMDIPEVEDGIIAANETRPRRSWPGLPTASSSSSRGPMRTSPVPWSWHRTTRTCSWPPRRRRSRPKTSNERPASRARSGAAPQ